MSKQGVVRQNPNRPLVRVKVATKAAAPAKRAPPRTVKPAQRAAVPPAVKRNPVKKGHEVVDRATGKVVATCPTQPAALKVAQAMADTSRRGYGVRAAK